MADDPYYPDIDFECEYPYYTVCPRCKDEIGFEKEGPAECPNCGLTLYHTAPPNIACTGFVAGAPVSEVESELKIYPITSADCTEPQQTGKA